MKNKLKRLLIVFMLLLVMPMTLILSGCGATASNEVLGVFFDSLIHDEESGYAIFEVDLNTPTKLEYKVNPSTWSGYRVNYAVEECTAENLPRFKLENGIITVEKSEFQDIKVEITINDLSDICIVRLKQYPKLIYPDVNEITINSMGSYAINVTGRFRDGGGNYYTQPITENDYDFLVETSDDTVISVPNKNKLEFCSIRKKAESATITVTLLNGVREKTDLSFTIKVNVLQNAEGGIVVLDKGYDKFVYNDTEVYLDLEELSKVGNNYLLKLTAYTYDAVDVMVENRIVQVQLSSKKFAEVVQQEDEMYISLSDVIPDEYELDVGICFDLINSDGTPFVLSFKIVINK